MKTIKKILVLSFSLAILAVMMFALTGCDFEVIFLEHEFENDKCIHCGQSVDDFFEFTYLEESDSYSISGGEKELYILPTKMFLPDTYNGKAVTAIKDGTFFECYNIVNVMIPDSIEYIEWYTFSDCKKLTNISVSEDNKNYTSIDGNLYSKDGTILLQYALGKKDEYFVTPDSVTTINHSAFQDCDNITSVIIGDSVTTIEWHAFEDCDNLTSVLIGDNVTTVSYMSFSCCKSLNSIVIPDSVTYIGMRAFCDCSNLISVKIGRSVEDIDDLVFENCTSLANIIVDGNNEYYKSDDGNLYSKNGETLIQYATGKSNTTFTIPDSVHTINREAFQYCSNLTSIHINDKVNVIGCNIHPICSPLCDPFYGCSNLTSIEVDKNNPYYTSIDGNLYSKDKKVLVKYALGKNMTFFRIPDGVTTIDDLAFYNCQKLTEVVIPSSVTKIRACAFTDCSNLKKVKFENINGWSCSYFYSNYFPHTEIQPSDLSDPAKAAECLTSTHNSCLWYKR